MDRSKFKSAMAAILKQPLDRLSDETLLSNLVTDSFVLIDMVIELQEEFEVFLVQDDLKDVKSVGDLIAAFEQKHGVAWFIFARCCCRRPSSPC